MSFRNPLYLGKSDRLVLLGLLAVVAVVLLMTRKIDTMVDHTLPAGPDSVAVSSCDPSVSASSSRYVYAEAGKSVEYFDFDPNTADSTQLLRLGLQPWQVRNIYRYRARGGVYRRPSDFARLYGLTAGQYKRLEPYIRISDDYRPAAEVYGTRQERRGYGADSLRRPVKLKPTERLPLNLADTVQLVRVPGIGSYYARKIVAYRQRLGGFASVDQLGEIDDFPVEAMAYFTVDAGHIHKLNVNHLTLNELKRHPYINYLQARAICDYRRLKGPLHNLDQLRLLREFPPEAIDRLLPYVAF